MYTHMLFFMMREQRWRSWL